MPLSIGSFYHGNGQTICSFPKFLLLLELSTNIRELSKSALTRRVKHGRNPMKKLARSTANRSQVIRGSEKLGIGFLDYGSVLWLLAPSGKVFCFGEMQSHVNLYEYGTKRGKLMREALSKAHPHSQPEFYPCPKSEAYFDALELIRAELQDCGDPDCAFCQLRGRLSAESENLLRLVQFYFQRGFSD
jgi:hypothetical protein